MEDAKIHPAHSWDCPLCGRENFVRALKFHMNSEQAKVHLAFLVKMGVDHIDSHSFEIITHPRVVKCQYCSVEFKAILSEEVN